MDSSPTAVKDVLKSPCKRERTNFVFRRPPEAPIFYPSAEEFEDPLKYINEISKEGLNYGIVKIIPPEGWKPPFALNYDNFKFKPRIQKINELEAITRIKLHFLSKVLQAVAREGKVPKVPYVDKSLLDLHQLYLIVCREGGPDYVSKKKKWNDIATEMGLTGKTVGQTLKQHYETCLVPYLESKKEEMLGKDESETDAELIKLTNIRELKSLEFLGPGPKMPTCNYNFSTSMKTRTRHKKVQYEFDPLAKYMCQACGKDDSDGLLVNCKTCYDKYHLVCLSPPLTDVPKDWICPKCIVACDPANPFENYGFETAEKEYSLKQFGLMADKFKHNHFKMSGRLVSLEKCEEEYWRLMGSMDSPVTVEYGADLSTMDVGSGFPTDENLQLDGYSLDTTKKYAQSKWNLNNLSVLRESALRHIVTNISGMKVPWVYVGMCFSTFCWHNEDHWSYSINYLHWGEPKTWYGVPGQQADKFEKEMKALVPELFENNSNILHELVTNMNPNLLMERGVPIYRTDQKEGEFVVTFPRAYHAGFNQGFNFAEACNFAPADWIHMGRKSVIYYAHFKRNCVFSHDELICKIAEDPSDVHKDISVAAFNDLRDMVFSEMNRRNHVKCVTGIKNSQRFDFSFAKDEDRQCQFCKTTCFLSAVYCPCTTNSLVCLDHSKNQCPCDPSDKILRYQYTFSELVDLLLKFFNIVDDIDTSLNLILAMYEYKEAKPFTLCKLLKQVCKKGSAAPFLPEFKKHVALTLRCCIISRFLVQSLVVRREAKENLSFDSLNFFYKCLKGLPWSIPELKSFENLVGCINQFQNFLSVLLDSDNVTKSQLESCLRIIKLLNVSFNEVSFLERKLEDVSMLTEPDGVTREVKTAAAPDPLSESTLDEGDVDDAEEINNLLRKVSDWNDRVKNLMGSSEKMDYDDLDELKAEGKTLKIDTACMKQLCGIIQEARKWIDKSTNLLQGEETLYLHEIDEFIKAGKSMPVELKNINPLEVEYNKSKLWLEKLKLAYCLNSSTDSLLQILWPRKFRTRDQYIGMQLNEKPGLDSNYFPQDFSPSSLKTAFEEEFKSLLTVRWENMQKKSLPYKNEKVQCACNSDISDLSVCCELCQTLYHYTCFPRDREYNKHFVSLPFKNPYCSFCIRTKRPAITVLDTFLKAAHAIKLKIPEYCILKHNVDMFYKLQKKMLVFINLRDVNCAYQKIVNHMPKDYNDFSLVNLHDRRILVLKFLLQQADMMEVSLPFSYQLWSIYEATKSDLANRKRVSKMVPCIKENNNSKKIRLISVTAHNGNNNKRSVEKRPVPRKRKNSNQQNKALDTSGNGPKKAKACPRKKTKDESEELPASLLERFTVDQLRAYLNEEMCAALTCLKPLEEEVHWVQCDGKCRLWFHMKCVNIGKDEVKDDDDYICLKCLFIDDKIDAESTGLPSTPVGL